MVCLTFQLANLRVPRRAGSIRGKRFDVHRLKSERGVSAERHRNVQSRVKVYQDTTAFNLQSDESSPTLGSCWHTVRDSLVRGKGFCARFCQATTTRLV